MRRWPMSTRLVALSLCLAFSIGGCLGEDTKSYDKSEFAGALAEAECQWIFTCCDGPERESLIGSGLDQSGCVNSKRTQYNNLFKDADPEQWRGEDAVSCANTIAGAAETCPRAYDVATELDQCEVVTSTKQPGDLCQSAWDCSTTFCKGGVCANPLPQGATCLPGDRCQTGLKCVGDQCVGLQPDGATCTTGAECISGACGGGQCVAAANFTCDGK